MGYDDADTFGDTMTDDLHISFDARALLKERDALMEERLDLERVLRNNPNLDDDSHLEVLEKITKIGVRLSEINDRLGLLPTI